jgi:L-glyceraldehyde 3-phosphate reductase
MNFAVAVKLKPYVFTRCQPLRLAGILPPLRKIRRQAAADFARPLAQFRREGFLRQRPRHRLRAFDLGITCFDLANNYGPPDGSAEETFGRILREDLGQWRDEMIITTKAGYYMWPGPYGEWGSRKNLLASLDQSLKRMGLDYVDIFYHHRPDPDTPLEETMGALAHAVRSGKALYVGLSNYQPADNGAPRKCCANSARRCLIHQPRYSMLDRWVEPQLLTTLEQEGIGCTVFSPLAKGLLTDRYFKGIPADSRAGHDQRFLRPADITDAVLAKDKKTERPRAIARPDAGANGAGLGVAAQAP